MNKVIMIGRLTKDPEVRKGGRDRDITIAHYSIAVDRRRKRDGDQNADLFDLVSFGKQGDFVEKYLRKGTKVAIVGELRNNNYTNKDGVKVYGMEIVVDDVEFAESKAASERAAANRDEPQEPGEFEEMPPDYDDSDCPF